jgi:hypothetical protein
LDADGRDGRTAHAPTSETTPNATIKAKKMATDRYPLSMNAGYGNRSGA